MCAMREASQQQHALWAQQDETTRFNFDIEAKVKQAYLAGDVEQAKKIIDQCRLTFPPARCKPFEWWGADFLDLMFMMWEAEDGRFAAALDRLKAMQWYPPELRALGLIAFGPHLARGDRTIILELKRLAEAAGGIFKSCVVQIWPTPYVPEFGTAAAIRKLACDGQVRAALHKAMSYENLRLRISALLVAAEGLAEIPGPAAETLQ
jgi:hypothetical protein